MHTQLVCSYQHWYMDHLKGSHNPFYDWGLLCCSGHFTTKSLYLKSVLRLLMWNIINTLFVKLTWSWPLILDCYTFCSCSPACIVCLNTLQLHMLTIPQERIQSFYCTKVVIVFISPQSHYLNHVLFSLTLNLVWAETVSHELFEVCSTWFGWMLLFCGVGMMMSTVYPLRVSSVCETFLCFLLSPWPRWAVMCEKQLQTNSVWVDKKLNTALWTADTWLFPSLCVREIQYHHFWGQHFHPAIHDGNG